jgi:beta-1,4-mannosyl-glycoprotein beta-1,4-N-acetylglucosaminyltransferase
MKIIDAFIFYNELNMLEYRFSVLDDVVDYFILVESTHTFVGKPKPLFFEENKRRYAKWLHKIIHIVDYDFPHIFPNIDFEKGDQWENEAHQRNCIQRGYEQLTTVDEDVLMISDLDELVDPHILRCVRTGMHIYFHSPNLDIYTYNLNTLLPRVWPTVRLISFKAIRELGRTPQQFRENKEGDIYVIRDGGWHLTYFGDVQFIQNKIENFSHQEVNKPEYKNESSIISSIEKKVDLCDSEKKFEHIKLGERKLPPMYRTYLKGFFSPPAEEPNVVDGFMFYNELNMLEYRLTIMDDVVDHFILVESTHTQNGKEKPLFFEENKQRFAKWLPKIIHIIVRDVPYVFPKIDYSKNQQWVNEHHQRNCIARGIEQLELMPKDIIMISDLDEITDPLLLRKVRSGDMEITLQGLDHIFYYYNLNTRNKYVTDRARILTYQEYDRLDLPCHSIREMKCPIISPAGWHLSYFGDALFIQNKIRSIADFGGDDTFTNLTHIQAKVKSSADLFNREGWGESYRLVRINVEDNPYLPPDYDKYLRAFYTPKSSASP